MFRLFSQSLKLLLQFLEIVIRELFQIDELIACAFHGADQLVQLEVHGFGVTVLCVLNQKHHQKRDDSRGRVNDELPCVGKMKSGSGNEPDADDKHGPGKGPGAAQQNRRPAGENTERVAHYAEEIVVFLVLFYFFELSLFHSITLASRPMRQLRA